MGVHWTSGSKRRMARLTRLLCTLRKLRYSTLWERRQSWTGNCRDPHRHATNRRPSFFFFRCSVLLLGSSSPARPSLPRDWTLWPRPLPHHRSADQAKYSWALGLGHPSEARWWYTSAAASGLVLSLLYSTCESGKTISPPDMVDVRRS